MNTPKMRITTMIKMDVDEALKMASKKQIGKSLPVKTHSILRVSTLRRRNRMDFVT